MSFITFVPAAQCELGSRSRLGTLRSRVIGRIQFTAGSSWKLSIYCGGNWHGDPPRWHCVVDNLEEAKRFVGGVLGLELQRELDVPNLSAASRSIDVVRWRLN